MANYLVTGGCGFIGSQLVKRLMAAGHAVTIIDDLSNGTTIHPAATLVQQDITEFEPIRDLFKGMDGCFHLAAKPTVSIDIEDWFRFHKTNLEGSLNVFKAAIEAGNIPVVYASSCGVYGNSKQLPLTEDQVIQPLSSYGCDKLSTELNAGFLAHDYQLPSIGLRFFNVYGPYQRPSSPYSGVITLFITQLLEAKPLIIFGDGQQTRDFIFVDDVVDNLMVAMTLKKPGAHVVNICTESSITINTLADRISSIMDIKCIKNHKPARSADVMDSCGSQKKMKSFGFKVSHDLNQGLMETINYFKTIAGR